MMLCFVLLAGVLTAVLLGQFIKPLVRKWKLERPNFLGQSIPLYGVFLVEVAVAMEGMLLLVLRDSHSATFLFTALIFGAVGLLDDLFGSRTVGGFRGHFGLLLRGKVTTGAIKALVGGFASLIVGLVVANGAIGSGLLNGALIALTANTLNLLDLRPGRAVSCFWLGAFLIVGTRLRHLSILPQFTCVLPAVAWVTMLDRSGKVMLGDAGSNLLGSLLGLAIVWESSATWKIVLVVLLVALHVVAEKLSISELIERNQVLKAIDSKLGVR